MNKKTIATILVTQVRRLMLTALVLFALALLWLVLLPSVDNTARAQMGLMSQQVDARLQRLLQGVETTLRTGQDFVQHGRVDADALARFNDFFIAIMANNAEISAVFLADDTGREIILLRGADGKWTNRISDPENLGQTTFWVTWNDKRELEHAERRELAYDARTRPWYAGAMALKTGHEVYWTPPYPFFTAQEPGVTASVRWAGANGRSYVLGHDVRLLDLSRFTASLALGNTGVAAIVQEGGELVALPKDARFTNDAALKNAALKTPQAVGLELVADGMAKWRAGGKLAGQVVGYWQGLTRWQALFTPTRIGPTPVWLAVFAARSEFVPAGWKELLAMLFIAVAALLGGTLMAVKLAKDFAKPLQSLTKESERIGRMELEQPVNENLTWSQVQEISVLATTQETMRSSLLRASEALRDTTRKAEMSVRDSAATLATQAALAKALLHAMPHPAFHKSADTRFAACNQAFADLLGLPREQFLGKRVDELKQLPLSQRHQLQLENEALLRGAPGVSRQQTMVFADGMPREVLYTVTAFHGADGSPAGLLGLVVPIAAA